MDTCIYILRGTVHCYCFAETVMLVGRGRLQGEGTENPKKDLCVCLVVFLPHHSKSALEIILGLIF